jgi:lysophospholipid acyltransferase (LPLAT)-like uncharacterized protein
MSVDLIQMWHERACPQPDARAFDVQLGCHFEEIVEMLDSIKISGSPNLQREARDLLEILATWLKDGRATAIIQDRKGFLDASADQVVTAVGAAYRANMKITEAVYRVNRSNWSKYTKDGKPIFNEHGKIAKGPDYQAPDLTGLY